MNNSAYESNTMPPHRLDGAVRLGFWSRGCIYEGSEASIHYRIHQLSHLLALSHSALYGQSRTAYYGRLSHLPRALTGSRAFPGSHSLPGSRKQYPTRKPPLETGRVHYARPHRLIYIRLGDQNPNHVTLSRSYHDIVPPPLNIILCMSRLTHIIPLSTT